jgi:two-component system, OmpR family, sensor histidine kinase KdpD
VCGLIFAFFKVVHVNATTVALSMLLLVLGTATKWGLREAVFTSLLCMVGFNYFFLPPVGTLTIADPQNWIALAAFIISAIVASQLSAKAKTRAEEASARSMEIERLYRLSRALLMDEETDHDLVALTPIRDIFGLTHIAFYDSETASVLSSDPGPLSMEQLANSAQTDEAFHQGRSVIVPVRLGTRVIGSLGFIGPELTQPERESIANLLAISYERTRALRRAATAEAARQGERLKRFVLDGIAHDLKTPLTAIKTCVTTLITIPPRTEEKRLELLNIIDEEAEHLHQTIDEAVQLARIEAQQVALKRSPICLFSQIEKLISGLPDSERFYVDIPETLTFSADPDLFNQALRQLIENARKYAGGDSAIEIRAWAEDSSVQITVSDRGPGISPRELDRIFDKFYRGTRTQTSTEGTGMGLSIAKGIIEAHGGKIWAQNRPGGGAVFVVQFPMA